MICLNIVSGEPRHGHDCPDCLRSTAFELPLYLLSNTGMTILKSVFTCTYCGRKWQE